MTTEIANQVVLVSSSLISCASAYAWFKVMDEHQKSQMRKLIVFLVTSFVLLFMFVLVNKAIFCCDFVPEAVKPVVHIVVSTWLMILIALYLDSRA